MKLSVIVPVYNVEKYLKTCLDSLLAQSYKDFEVLIVNDGSTDHSQDIIDTYTSKHPHFQCLNKSNGGLSDARNFAIEYVKGEYIAFIDSDDYIEPNMFKSMMELAENNRCDCVICDMKYIYDDGREVIAKGSEFEPIAKSLNLLQINNSACNKIYRKELFNELRFPKGMWYEDLATIPIALYRANEIGYVHEAFYNYYQRQGSIAHRKHDKMFDIYLAIDRVKDILANEVSHIKDLMVEIQDLYLRHGLFLTTLRIKEIENMSERADYMHKNIDHLDDRYPLWHHDARLKQFSFKARLIFILFRFKQFKLAARMYR